MEHIQTESLSFEIAVVKSRLSVTARYASHDSLNSLGFLSDTLRLFVTVDVIDLLHDPVGPLHGSGNHLVCSRTSLRPSRLEQSCRAQLISCSGSGTDRLYATCALD
jgi:hypothetical protein